MTTKTIDDRLANIEMTLETIEDRLSNVTSGLHVLICEAKLYEPMWHNLRSHVKTSADLARAKDSEYAQGAAWAFENLDAIFDKIEARLESGPGEESEAEVA